MPEPARIRTEVVCTGRRVATGQACLSQDGVEALRVTASSLVAQSRQLAVLR